MSDCPNCDYLNPDNAKFCQECGTPLQVRSEVELNPSIKQQTEEPVVQPRGLTANEKMAIVGMLLVALLVIGIGAALSYRPNQTVSTSPTNSSPNWHQV